MHQIRLWLKLCSRPRSRRLSGFNGGSISREGREREGEGKESWAREEKKKVKEKERKWRIDLEKR